LLSTRELADRAEISPATVWRIERGEVGRLRPSTMRAIAKALKVNPTEVEEFARALGVTGESAANGRDMQRPSELRRNRPVGDSRQVPTTALASEPVLARDWLSPEEDEAWAHL
jgi:transcriptional regulator with XRE-family HTH domain